jgi:hypothetical protein
VHARRGLEILKNRLREGVRLAASGETILVIDRDAVAELVPPRVVAAAWPRTPCWRASAGWLTSP